MMRKLVCNFLYQKSSFVLATNKTALNTVKWLNIMTKIGLFFTLFIFDDHLNFWKLPFIGSKQKIPSKRPPVIKIESFLVSVLYLNQACEKKVFSFESFLPLTCFIFVLNAWKKL